MLNLFMPYSNELNKLEDSFFFLNQESPEIYYQLKKTVLSGGKRLRPLLVFMSSEIFDLKPEAATILASAAEMIHAASLCHDDVLDEAQIRRSDCTLNVLEGNKKAILSGDFLFALALKNLCQLKNVRTVETASSMIASLSQGEWTQETCRKNRNYSYESVEKIAEAKTASLFSWAFLAPALNSHATDEQEHLAKQIGRELGLAFQIVDDIVDFKNDSGKEIFIDLKHGILNSVSFDYFSANNLLADFKEGKIQIENYCRLELYTKSLEKAQIRAKDHLLNSKNAFHQLLDLRHKKNDDKRFTVYNIISEELLKKA